MKNQRMKTEARNFRFSTVAVVVLMLAALLCCFTVLASAASEQVVVTEQDLTIPLQKNGAGLYTKVYDGNTNVGTVVISDEAQARFQAALDAADQSAKLVATASYNAATVADANEIVITFAVNDAALNAKYESILPDEIRLPATVTKKQLTWSGNATGAVTYVPGQAYYDNIAVVFGNTVLNGLAGTDSFTNPTDLKVAINNVTGVGADYTAQTTVNLGSALSANYTVAPLTVKVTVNALKLDSIKWETEYNFLKGDMAAAAIRVYGHDNETNKDYELKVVYLDASEAVITLDPNKVGSYYIKVESPNAGIEMPDNVSTKTALKITAPSYTVSMKDATYIGNEGAQDKPTVFMLFVDGEMPADVRALIKYYVNNAEFNGASAYGSYVVTAKLPEGYTFYEEGNPNKPVTELTKTLTIKRAYVAAGTADAPYQLILIGENGFTSDITASITIPEKLNRKAIGGFRVHTEYTLTVKGADGETFTVLVPLSDMLYHKRCADLTAADIYIYDEVTGTMQSAQERGYTVTLKDGYYQVEGVSGNAPITFVLAPEYNAPFWLTPWGILLLVLLVLALLALLFLIGMYLRRVRETEENEAIVIDTEGDVPEVVAVEIEDKVDADAVLDENLDQMAEDLQATVAAEEAEMPEAEGVDEAVAESMQEIIDEASALELEKAEEVAEEEPVDDADVAAAMADEMADALQDTVAAEDVEAEADADALRAAVEEALAENFNESADATDAILLVAEEEADEITPEDFRAVVDAIVSDAMCNTMQIPEEAAEEVAAEEAVAEETVAEETVAEETVAEEAVAEEAVAEEAVAEEVVEEATEEATEEVATEETAEEIVVEEMSNDEICAVVADAVAEAFEMVTVDGAAPKAVEGTTLETITEAVNNAADANVPENWTEDMANAVKEAVVEELAARLLVEEPAVEAFAEIVEEVAESDEDDDNDNDNDDEDEGFGGFGSMPLDYIDAVEEADKYLEMLEQERRGEIRIVTRYRRSFQSRLAQSQGNVQEYYNIIKNALLSYKGVKNRVSWNYEAFNKGRAHVAKINAKTKTLYLYLALDPTELVDTKYGIVDMSSKKKYASVPVLMKIKGERKFKYALELIDKLCGENLVLPKLELEDVDYRIPYQTTEELVQAGIVKKLVASVPVVYSDAPVSEEPVEAVTPATEEQTVTFIAPTDAPAVEAAAEEVAAEEANAEVAPVEEAVAEDVPANAEADGEENKNV